MFEYTILKVLPLAFQQTKPQAASTNCSEVMRQNVTLLLVEQDYRQPYVCQFFKENCLKLSYLFDVLCE